MPQETIKKKNSRRKNVTNVVEINETETKKTAEKNEIAGFFFEKIS